MYVHLNVDKGCRWQYILLFIGNPKFPLWSYKPIKDTIYLIYFEYIRVWSSDV